MPPRASTEPYRTCIDCGEVKAVVEFQRKGVAWDGTQKYQSYCKPCQNTRRKKYPPAPGATQRYSAAYSARNPGLRAAQQAALRALDPEAFRRYEADRHILKRFGLTRGEWHVMLIDQSGRCATCLQPMLGKICVDHCHATGAVRGLLCDWCNKGLGSFRDQPEILRRAAAYLEGSL